MSKLIASAGPFQGVREQSDRPYVDTSKYLGSAFNGYFLDPSGASSWTQRPGFTNPNYASQIGGGQRTQGQCAHVDPTSNTIYRFFAVNGHLYRSNDTFTVFTDVTPGTVTIDANALHVSFASVGASLIVTDGVNKPWVASSFATTPIVGANINMDAAANAWSAWGKPTVYQDSVFFITQTVPGGSAVTPRVGLVWSEPNQPTVGYTQTGYADFWNVIENGSDPLYAILGTNNGLFYWRQSAIGVLAGTPSLTFSTSATRDARGTAVGSVSPWAIAQYQNTIFFVDLRGRPYRMDLAGEPEPLWMQNPSEFQTSVSLDITHVSTLSVGAVAPEINQYVVASVPSIVSSDYSPIIANAYDAISGNYSGNWVVASDIGINAIDLTRDSTGATVMVWCGGGGLAGSIGGYVWVLNSIAAGSWQDVGGTTWNTLTLALPHLLGYTADEVMYPDYAVFVVRSPQAFSVVFYGENSRSPAAGLLSVTPVPQPNSSGTQQEYRATVGMDGAAIRGLLISPLGILAGQTAQWGIQRIEIYGSRGKAGPDDA